MKYFSLDFFQPYKNVKTFFADTHTHTKISGLDLDFKLQVADPGFRETNTILKVKKWILLFLYYY